MPGRIEDYALIGDTHTAALVGKDGSIDWMCVPRFDSGAVFSALLGTPEHGRWQLAPAGGIRSVERRYHGAHARARDHVPHRRRRGARHRLHADPASRRRGRADRRGRLAAGSRCTWTCTSGSTTATSSPGYATVDGLLQAKAGPNALVLNSPVHHHGAGYSTVADFVVEAGEQGAVRARVVPVARGPAARPATRCASTTTPWAGGTDGCSRRTCEEETGRAHHAVAHHAQGAHLRADGRHRRRAHHVVAGVDRQRSQLGLPVLLAARLRADARRAHGRRVHERSDGVARLAAARRGRASRRSSRSCTASPASAGSPSTRCRGSPGTRTPRRCASATRRATSSSSTCTARRSRRCTSCARTSRRADDDGTGRLVAVRDRAARVPRGRVGRARRGDLGSARRPPALHPLEGDGLARVRLRGASRPRSSTCPRPLDRWRRTRDEIHDLVCDEGYNPELGSFTQAFGSTQLDAALLQLPMVGFLPPTDDRVIGTVAAIERGLLRDGFVLRYRSETRRRRAAPGEGVFLPCSFWLVDNYVLQGRTARPARCSTGWPRLTERRRPVLRGVRPAFRAAAREHAPSVHASRVRAGRQAGHRGRAREPPVLTGHRVSRTTAPRSPVGVRPGANARDRLRHRPGSERPRVRLARRPTCARSGDAPRRDCIAAPDAQRVLPRQGMGRVRRGGDPARRDARHRPGPDRRALDEGAARSGSR